MTLDTVLTLDVGGTHIRAAAVDVQGHIHMLKKERTELFRLSANSPAEAGKQIVDTLVSILAPLRKAHPDVRIAGLGFPGFFHGDSGILAASPNIPRLHEFDLATALAARLNMAVCVQNDALLAAVGEFHFGIGRGLDHLLHITLGTGIGGGVVIDGHAYSGEGGMAMEVGHLRVEPVDSPTARLCGCGNRGCLEAYASANSIASRYAETAGDATARSAEQVHALAQAGNHPARGIIEDAGRRLGGALAEAVKLLDIHHISISGGLTGAWDILYPPLCREIENGLIPPMRDHIRVYRSTLGDRAGLLGAAAYALRQGLTTRP